MVGGRSQDCGRLWPFHTDLKADDSLGQKVGMDMRSGLYRDVPGDEQIGLCKHPLEDCRNRNGEYHG